VIVALPKGVALKHSLAIVAHVVDAKPDSRQLHFCGANGIEVILVKHRDIPDLLTNDLIDIGVTSTDWLIEKRTTLLPYLELDWCFTKIALISKRECTRSLNEQSLCVTEFPTIAAQYVKDRGLAEMLKLIHVSGSTEAYVGSVCDFSIDCVETGETLRQNGLVQREIIKRISTVVVASRRGRSSARMFQDLLSEAGHSARTWVGSY
jgi:ATP phosphoribosyltransferase